MISLFEHDLRANALCLSEGKPASTHLVVARGHAFPDHAPHFGFRWWNQRPGYAFSNVAAGWMTILRPPVGENAMSLGTILIIILIIFLLGGFSGRFGGYGYGMGHSGMGLGGVILIVLLVLLLLGKL